MRPLRVLRCCFFTCIFFTLLVALKLTYHVNQSENNIDQRFLFKGHQFAATNRGVASLAKLTKTTTEANSNDHEFIDWHNYKQIEEDSKRQGPGEQGTGVDLDPSEKEEALRLRRANGFNAFVSDKISLTRALPDIRHPECKHVKYRRQLPTVSVIIPFYNEHWTTLLRTFISALNRSPPGVIKEVILVDDFSNKPFLKKQLDEYIESNFNTTVRVIRATKHEGLIRARLLGANQATGDVLVILDSHCECSVNWLPPLLDPIAKNYKSVVCPLIDVIDHTRFDYHLQDNGARGSFDWNLLYKRLPKLPEDKLYPTRPFDSPVMAGGLFAMSRKWFYELGGYDPGLEVWGAEQYELSFKIWQCGGRLVDAPCSRIGHIYRMGMIFPKSNFSDPLSRNIKRVAEVWMDEYKMFLSQYRSGRFQNIDMGDISKQRAVRRRLNCKTFKWFMTEVAFDLPEYYPMVERGPMAYGKLRNVEWNLCVDSKFKTMQSIKLNECISADPNKARGLGVEQDFEFTWRKDIRPMKRSVCFDFSEGSSPLILYACHNYRGNQHWKYDLDTKEIIHVPTSKCLDANPSKTELILTICSSNVKSQQWQFDHINEDRVRYAFVHGIERYKG